MNAADTTVIVLTCNRERFVAEALAALRAQAYPGWELVLSDASTDPLMRKASSDAFALHAREAPRNHSRFLCCKPGLTQAEHLAAVFAEVHTPYVALLDDDDVWMPGHLAHAHAWLEGDARRGVFLANSIVMDTEGRVSGVRQLPERTLPPEDDIPACLEHILRYAYSSTSGIVLRTAAVSGHDFFITSCVDVHLCISALLAGMRLGLRIRPGIYYRVHSGSAYAKGFQAHVDRHRLRLHLAATHGRQISRLVPVFPLLVLKSALLTVAHSLSRAGRRNSRNPAKAARSIEEPAMLAR
jgi:glycosyltransferase involved in cell wall biosynthesis